MSIPLCRLLPTHSLDGAHNMAADEVMLLLAADQPIASLRFYTWTEPTLSLGYFQPAAERLANPLLANAAWVRRPSGGGAIMHHHELTYCLALPAGLPWQTKESWICRFHAIIADALTEFGVEAQSVGCGEEKKLDPFLCFPHQAAGDLLITGSKIAGSAQRKMRGALMQHGSILLAQSELTPSLPGIAELSGRKIKPDELQSALLRHFTSMTGWILERENWTREDLQRIEETVRDKYSSDTWNAKR